MNELTQVDSSPIMETFRSARSYNDIVMGMSTIRTAVRTIASRIAKPKVSQLLTDVKQLELFSYALQFARTLTSITTDKKTEKFKVLCDTTERELNIVVNNLYKTLDHIGQDVSEPETVNVAELVKAYLTSTLEVSSCETIVLPYKVPVHYLIFKNILNEDNYIIREFVVAVRTLFIGTSKVTQIAFPSRVTADADFETLTPKNLMTVVKAALQRDRLKILKVGSRRTRTVAQVEDVEQSYLEDGVLCCVLRSGISPTDINKVLTNLLPVLHIALDVKDPRRDILHKISVLPNGDKIIKVAIYDRNFKETKALRQLRKALKLDPKTYNRLLDFAKV